MNELPDRCERCGRDMGYWISFKRCDACLAAEILYLQSA
jgi:ribosomal protein L37E